MNTESQVEVNAAKAHSLAGNYISLTPFDQTGQYMTLTINGQRATLALLDTDGDAVSTITSDGMTDTNGNLNVQPHEAFYGIKSFSISPEGSFIYQLKAQMENGEQKTICFWDNGIATFADRSDDATNEIMLKAAKGITTGFVRLLPGGGFFSEIVKSVFPSTLNPDMKVKEAYQKLSNTMEQIQAKLNSISDKMEDLDMKNALIDHNNEQSALFEANNNCMSQIASLCDGKANIDINYIKNNDALNKQVTSILREWGTTVVAGNSCNITAKLFVKKVVNGYGIPGQQKSWAHIVDTYAERTFPWEHQGYEFREMYRSRDMITSLESAMILDLYHELIPGGTSLEQQYVTTLKDNYKKDEVVRDNDHAVCQIKGANHLKIDRKSYHHVPFFREGDTPTYTFSTDFVIKREMHEMGIGCMSYELIGSKAPWFVIANGSKMNADEQKKAMSEMMTLQEAQAIFNHYGGKLSFHEILQNEAGITDNNYQTDKENIFMLSNGEVKLNVNWTDDTKVSVEQVCHMDRKDNTTFYGFYFGKCNHNKKYDDNDIYHYFNHWTELNQNVHFKDMKIDSRTAGWQPAQY